MRKRGYASIIGGANMDIQGFPRNRFILRDSNPGRVRTSSGGVGRNIGENLARMGIDTKLITAVGTDLYGKRIIEDTVRAGVNMEGAMVLEAYPTSIYLSILDERGDMIAAISHMDIFDSMDIDAVKDRINIIKESAVCVIDTNIPESTIEYIVENCTGTDFFLDPVSTTKAVKVRNVIGRFHTIKPNKLEAEVLTGIRIDNEWDLKNASQHFLEKGVKRVFISLGEGGVFYSDGMQSRCVAAPKVSAVNATGAGDAFMAGLVFGYFNGFELDYNARFATASSILALSHENTINPGISEKRIIEIMEEMEI
jgi:pseudouridine kinase